MAKKKTYYDYLRDELGSLVEQLELPDLYKQSLKQRWIDQVLWADKKADQCRRWHQRLRLTTIISGVVLPALVGINFQLGKDNAFFRAWFPYVPFVLSQVIAVSAALEEFHRYGDRWRDYRKMAEDLKAEGWQYLQLSGSYEHLLDHMEGYSTFASRVESVIKNDVQNYIAALQQQQAKENEQIKQILKSANDVSTDKTLFAQSLPSQQPQQLFGSPSAGMAAGAPFSPQPDLWAFCECARILTFSSLRNLPLCYRIPTKSGLVAAILLAYSPMSRLITIICKLHLIEDWVTKTVMSGLSTRPMWKS
jgi:hypothetical protein